MTAVDVAPSRLPELIALARESSSDKRRTLLRELTDHFFSASSHAASELELYGEVLSSLASEMETAVRAELSVRFSRAMEAPRDLIRRLANDDVAVAREVIEGSPILTESDLIEIASTQGQDHLRAVSRRAEVPGAVSDVIVGRGDDETLGALLSNHGAHLSRAASETAIDRAKVNPSLHFAAVSRADLPPDLLNEMYFVVEARLRQKILERNARMDPALLENALAAGRDRLATDDGVLPADYAESHAYVQELAAAGQLTPPMLARFLRSNSRTTFLIALSKLADIDFHTARVIVERRELDALAVVCHSADLERALFLTYAVVLLGDEGEAMARAHEYARMYSELDKDTALRTMRFWRLRREARAA